MCCPVCNRVSFESSVSTLVSTLLYYRSVPGVTNSPVLLAFCSSLLSEMLRPEDGALTADHYRQFRRKLVQKGATKKDHATSTKNNIRYVKERWKRFAVPQIQIQDTFTDGGAGIVNLWAWNHSTSSSTAPRKIS